MNPCVAGVDGCRGGWVVVLLQSPASPTARLAQSFAEILSLPERPSVIAVDMPIGLPERASKGGRGCCNLARARLGDRQSSVFSVPARAALAARSYEEPCAINLEHSDPPRKIAKQTFNILDREVACGTTARREGPPHGDHGVRA